MIALNIIVETHWGLSINHFLGTKSRPALRIIPPTTLMGALAYPLARLNKWPENRGGYSYAEHIRHMFKGIYYTVLSDKQTLIIYGENTKIYFYKEKSKGVFSDSVPFPKLYSVEPAKISIYYIIDEEKSREILGKEWKKQLLASAVSLTRIGAKESIVSVIGAKYLNVEIVNAKIFETRYTIPLDNIDVRNISGRYIISKVIDWRKNVPIGNYFGKPTVLVAQPILYDRSVTINQEIPYIYKVASDYLVPWIIEKH